MPRLQILVHKSYHPYLESNKQRVRDDEAKAAAEEEIREKNRLEESSTNRLNALRQRQRSPRLHEDDDLPSTSASLHAGPSSRVLDEAKRLRTSKQREDKRSERAKLEFDWPEKEARRAAKRAAARQSKDEDEAGETSIWEPKGAGDVDVDVGGQGRHVNFWAGLEKQTNALSTSKAAAAVKKTPDEIQDDDPTTMYLNRPLRETRPWYTDPNLKRYEETAQDEDERAQMKRERRKRREESTKISQDPLTQVQQALSSTRKSPPRSTTRKTMPAPAHAHSADPKVSARLSRENSERERAMALIKEQRRKMAAGTPSASVRSGALGGEEEDRWDPRALREAKEARVRQWAAYGQRWDDDPRPPQDTRRSRGRSLSPPRRYWQ